MNTDPHTKANIFYTVLSIFTTDSCELDGEITRICQEIIEHDGHEN